MRPQLSNTAARRLFLNRHALLEQPVGPARGADLLDLIHRLGFVQLDSINTVARAHDMILFSRRPTYREKNLRQLYENDRSLFEHWTHDAAVIPMAFFPHWQLRFRRDAELLKSRWRNWRRDGFEARFDAVLKHVRDHGPVSSSDVGKDEKKASGGWWDWHPSKTALEYLWRSGALTVVGRSGFQKRYDLTERVIDNALLASDAHPAQQETVDWCCNQALDRLGFATPGELASFWATITPAEARRWCNDQCAGGAISEIEIECVSDKPRRVYARPGTIAVANDLATAPGRVRVLSPFDPALRDRARAERLFGFRYRIEVFVPADQRQYGYYVFPLLEGDRIIGRIDMKARRDTGVLAVRAMWPERGVRWSKGRAARLETELSRIARFAGLGTVAFENGWLRGAA